MYIFVIILVIVIILLISYYFIKRKTRSFLRQYFRCDTFKEAFEKTEILSNEIPKSISSMEPIYKNSIKEDFPDTNIDELKSIAEKCVLDLLYSIEKKDKTLLKKYTGKIVSYAEQLIDDFKNKNVMFENIKIHRTAISNYKHDDICATITLTTTLEYFCKLDDELKRKVQDRFKTELIYVIDTKKYGKTKKSVGINCPNCGAPITNLGNKSCVYCGSSIRLITKNVWIINNIKRY